MSRGPGGGLGTGVLGGTGVAGGAGFGTGGFGGTGIGGVPGVGPGVGQYPTAAKAAKYGITN